jgi:hypothetical protein
MNFRSLRKIIYPNKLSSYAIFAWIVPFLCLSLVFIGGFFFTKDLYFNRASKLTCLRPLQGFWQHAIHGNLYINNVLCIETTDSALQVYTFYTQHGWYCDGACEYGQSLNFGLLDVSIYKRLYYSQSIPIRISLFEEYGIGLKKISP